MLEQNFQHLWNLPTKKDLMIPILHIFMAKKFSNHSGVPHDFLKCQYAGATSGECGYGLNCFGRLHRPI